MSDIDSLHEEAMRLAEMAFLERARGNSEIAIKYFTQALEFEKNAAFILTSEIEAEPTRSVLFRSAATLAITIKNFKEAERLVAFGLCGNPPNEIADELRDIFDQANFFRHLEVKEFELLDTDVQISIAGDSTASGIIELDLYKQRLYAFEALSYRTAERQTNEPFRTAGGVNKKLKQAMRLYASLPRSGSYAISIRFGAYRGEHLFDDDRYLIDNVINDIMVNVDLINNNDFDKLSNNIKDTVYLDNFITWVREIAPDGKKVKQVGLTRSYKGKEDKLSFLKIRKDIIIPSKTLESQPTDYEDVIVKGKLTAADAIGKKIRLSGDGKYKEIDIKEGMSEVVKTYWDSDVTLKLRKKGNNYLLLSIEDEE